MILYWLNIKNKSEAVIHRAACSCCPMQEDFPETRTIGPRWFMLRYWNGPYESIEAARHGVTTLLGRKPSEHICATVADEEGSN